MSDKTPIDIVTAYFAALAEGRVTDALALFHPQIQWHQPGDNRFSGVHIGPENVNALLGGMMEVSQGSLVVVPTGPLMGNGDFVAVPVRFTGHRDGASLDQPGMDLITVQNAYITAVHLFSSDGPAEDEFWGS